jgi:hypothetical protein
MEGRVRGGETYIITKHIDGRRTLRTHCAIDENSPRVLRDTVTTVDAAWRPLDGFVQITVDEALQGCAWYRFTDTTAVCEGWTAAEGRASRSFDHDRPVGFFVSHSLQSDAMHLAAYDLGAGPGVQRVGNAYTCSLHHRGATGPSLYAMPRGYNFIWLGRETITVAAGTFPALKFRYGISDSLDDASQRRDIHPPYTIWITDDGDFIMVKAAVTGYMQTHYELTELERRRGVA